ncbi:neugrin [Conger conger]|uniref:neugrin n=1 Tax=Conger conger TaxID=82655 RepID=UPI002A59D552|nr:neugrin [Conger conger]XP_061114328.1 neugrin [Conger conger]
MLPRAVPCLRILAVHGLGRRWAGGDARVWTGQRRAQQGQDPRAKDSFIEDPDTAEVQDRLRALARDEKRRLVAIKFQRLRKELGPPPPKERALSCDAMDQIRYLKQEFPEEWTVARLAEGFAVGTDVIHRILRSKFIPSAERRAKQDSKVTARVQQQSLLAGTHPGGDRPQLPESRNALLPAGTGSALTTSDHRSLGPGQDVATTAPSGGHDSPGSLTLLPTPHSPVWSSTTPQELQTEQQSFITQEEEEEEEDEDCWDGWVLSDMELEELVRTHPEQNDQVVQKGSEFFDSAGNFLYRI